MSNFMGSVHTAKNGGITMRPHRHLTGMFSFILKRAPATRGLSLGNTNGFNCPFALRIVPSQLKQLLLGP